MDTARQFLSDADREYESGDILQASEKLWCAATHVVIAEMQRRGLEPNGHGKMKRFVSNLGDELNQPDLYALFKISETLHINFYHGFLSENNFEEHREMTRQFVGRMIDLTG
ncbi:MAG: hypothetical protein F4X40_09495 [Chloroflexi bacterium]|nr:hypothetical protein [Chloroflexota bacterium]